LGRFLARLAAIETLLWILAIIAAIAALFLLAPALFGSPAAAITPVALLQTDTPRPTLTPVPTGTPFPQPPDPRAETAIPLPSLQPDAEAFTFVADPTQSGWIASGEAKPHWADRNLHVGDFRGQTYQSLLYFDLNSLPPGSKVLYAEVDLTGLSRDNLGVGGGWKLELLKPDLIPGWSDRTVSDYERSGVDAQIGNALSPADLDAGQVNQFIFSPDQYSFVEHALDTTPFLTFRLDGPTGSADSLFTWDGAGLDLKAGAHPTLRLVVIPGKLVIVTNTPTPENVLTAAVELKTVNAFIAENGTSTPFPRNYATATAIIYVTPQPTPENVETRVALAQYATAVAQTTGTFTPTPSNWILVTPHPATWTPLPTWTPYALPPNALTPIATATPFVSAAHYLPTPIPDFVPGSEIPFKGNILYFSNHYGSANPLLMKPDGTFLSQLTGIDLYYRAAARDQFAPDHERRLDYPKDSNGIQQIGIFDPQYGLLTPITNVKRIAYDAAWSPDGNSIAYVSTDTGGDEIYVYDLGTRQSHQVTFSGQAYPFNKHPSWSPDSRRIVFWSSRDGHAQIYIVNADGSGLTNLSNDSFNDTSPVWVKP
jgi:WD40-like Beta Propeller Repeat